MARHRAALLAQRGRFDESMAAFEEARQISEDLGDGLLYASLKGHFLGPSLLLAGDAERAAEVERAGYEELTALGHVGFANTAAANLARSLLELGRDDEAETWARTALEIGSTDDPAAAGPALAVAGRILARRGEFDAAMEMGQRSLTVYEGSDYLDQIADAHADFAEGLHLAGRNDEAIAELRLALDLYDRKEHLVGAEKTRKRMADLGVTPAA
jgi:tetratricopeptide (TPR) repeat protein